MIALHLLFNALYCRSTCFSWYDCMTVLIFTPSICPLLTQTSAHRHSHVIRVSPLLSISTRVRQTPPASRRRLAAIEIDEVTRWPLPFHDLDGVVGGGGGVGLVVRPVVGVVFVALAASKHLASELAHLVVGARVTHHVAQQRQPVLTPQQRTVLLSWTQPRAKSVGSNRLYPMALDRVAGTWTCVNMRYWLSY